MKLRHQRPSPASAPPRPAPPRTAPPHPTPPHPTLPAPQASVLTPSHAFNRVNWEDPHSNIALPIFCIHGNHADPVRDEGGRILAPLDVLR